MKSLLAFFALGLTVGVTGCAVEPESDTSEDYAAIQSLARPVVIVGGYGYNATGRSKTGDALPSGLFVLSRKLQASYGAANVVFADKVGPKDSNAVRAKQLYDHHVKPFCDRGIKVDILAHSMGGLTARHMIETMRKGTCVHSLTMVSTPNAGTAVANGVVPKDVAAQDLTPGSTELQALNAPGIAGRHAGVAYRVWSGLSGVGNNALASETRPADAAKACDGRLFDPKVRKPLASFPTDPSAFDTMESATMRAQSTLLGLQSWNCVRDGWVCVESTRLDRIGDASTRFEGCVSADHVELTTGFEETGAPNPRTKFDYAAFWTDLVARVQAP
jgi:pimeloyl-ACP methyl ester carboxylesterase